MGETRTVTTPESVLLTAQSLDDIEGWLAANDPAFLERIRRIRRDEDLADSGKDLQEILQTHPAIGLLKLIAQGEEDLRAGHTVPQHEVFSHLRQRLKGHRNQDSSQEGE